MKQAFPDKTDVIVRINQIFPVNDSGLLRYQIAEAVTAFSPLRSAELPFPVLQAHQVHGDAIAVVTDRAMSSDELDGVDALVTSVPGLAIGARTADCVPVLIFDPQGKVVAAVHSGWKGTVRKISAKTIKLMGERFGSRAEDILAVIGPSIGPKSFQVGAEVAEQFRLAGFPMTEILKDEGDKVPGTMHGGLHIDLWEANRLVLQECGVHPANILISGLDTYEHPEFFSARREGTGCGRTVNTIMLRDGSSDVEKF